MTQAYKYIQEHLYTIPFGLTILPALGITGPRDGPLEKLWGGGEEGEFSSRRNFFCYESTCMNVF